MTNNSTKSRKGYLGKFTGLGLNISAEEIYSSSYAAAAYLDSIDFPKDKKVQSTLITLEQMSQKSHILLAVCHQRAFRSGPFQVQLKRVAVELATLAQRNGAELIACRGLGKKSALS